MTTQLDAILAAPHDVDALGALLTSDTIDGLLHDAGLPFEDEQSPRVADALGRVIWLFDERSRRDFRPAVMKKGKVVTPASNGPLDARYERVMLARLKLLAHRVEHSDDAMPQTALNIAFRALGPMPSDAIATLAERIFALHGDRTGEPLSLAEALFPFTEPLPPIVATLRDALIRRAEDQGWVEV